MGKNVLLLVNSKSGQEKGKTFLYSDGFSDSSEVEKIEYRNDCGKIQRQV